MKRLALILLLSGLLRAQSAPGVYNSPLLPNLFTVATLPTSATPGVIKGVMAVVTDGNGTSCTSGSGTTPVLCIFNGSTWGPAGAAANGAVIPVANLPGATFDVQLGNCQTLVAGASGVVCDATGYITGQTCAATVIWTTSNSTIYWPLVNVTMGTGIQGIANPCVWIRNVSNVSVLGDWNKSQVSFCVAGPANCLTQNLIRVTNSNSTFGTTKNLTVDLLESNYSASASPTFTVSAADCTSLAFAANDLAHFQDTNAFVHEWIAPVLSANCGTGVITLGAQPPDSFFVFAGATVSKVPNVSRNIHISGLRLTGSQSDTGTNYGIKVDQCAFCEVDHILAEHLDQGLYINGDYKLNLHDIIVLDSGSNNGGGINLNDQANATLNNISIDDQGKTWGVSQAFNFVLNRVHNSTITNVNIECGKTAGRCFKFTRSNHNEVSSFVAANAGDASTNRNGLKIEKSAHSNTFSAGHVWGNDGSGVFISEGASYNKFVGDTVESNTVNQYQTIVDLTLNLCRGAGLSGGNCNNAAVSFTITHSAGSDTIKDNGGGNWATSCDFYNCVGGPNQRFLVRGIGFTNGGNNNWFLVTGISTGSSTGDTLTVSDPLNLGVTETCAAVCDIVGYPPDDGNQVVGGHWRNDRVAGGAIFTLEGDDTILDGVQLQDDQALSGAGVNWLVNSGGSGTVVALNPSTNVVTNRRNQIVHSTFSGFPNVKDIDFTNSNATNTLLAFNFTPDNITTSGAGIGLQNIAPIGILSGTNSAGINTVMGNASGTGTGLPDAFIIQGGESDLATGTTAQAPLPRLKLNKVLSLTSGAASTIASIPLPTLNMTGGWIQYHLEGTDGTNQCTLDGNIHFSGENSAGVFVVAPAAATGNNQSNSCTATKTLTATWTLTGANPALLQVTPTLTGITATRFTGVFTVFFNGNTSPTL